MERRRRAELSSPTPQALADWADAGGYPGRGRSGTSSARSSALGDTLGAGASTARCATLSGGEQKRLVLEALLRGPDEVLLLDEPDNYLDVPGKRWLEEPLARVPQDRPVRQPRPRAAARTTYRVVTVERRYQPSGSIPAASRPTTRPGVTGTSRLEELRRRWEEEHEQAQGPGPALQQQAAYHAGHGLPVPRDADPAAQVRGGRSAAGAPQAAARAERAGARHAAEVPPPRSSRAPAMRTYTAAAAAS